mmetsp:Transcript_42845/g.100600  ORF Transcript_42845/g.100600 Transcript_42845/m.100600 type:complete len:80 (-) Transcript_42845:1005-1244(-)
MKVSPLTDSFAGTTKGHDEKYKFCYSLISQFPRRWALNHTLLIMMISKIHFSIPFNFGSIKVINYRPALALMALSSNEL